MDSAFFSFDQQTLVRDAYNKPEAVILEPDERRLALDNTPLAILPPSYRDMFTRIKATKTSAPSDRSRPVTIWFKTPATHDCVTFAFRALGYLRSADLGPFGNWNRESDGCPRAINVLTLERGPGDDHGSWVAQVRGLNYVQKAVANHIRGFNLTPKNRSFTPEAFSESDDTVLRFQRRIFTKAGPNSPTPALPDDLHDDADYALVRHEWHLTPSNAVDALQFGRRTPEGRLAHGDWTEFQPGDFVEITATIDVAVIGGPHQRARYNINLKPRRITLLAEANQVPASGLTSSANGPGHSAIEVGRATKSDLTSAESNQMVVEASN